MTGHGGFSEYLTRFKCKENPSCICDPGVSESVQHILFECPVDGLMRHDIEQELDTKLTIQNVSSIMMDKNKKDIFIDYCIK